LVRPFERKATGVIVLDRGLRIRVKVAPKPAGDDLWARLREGT
jgi:hypothetical protein